MAQLQPFFRRNRFAFPAGNPGFDPMHLAAQELVQGFGVSAIATGSNFTSLLSGQPFTPSGTGLQNTIRGDFGPCAGVSGAASSGVYQLTGQSTATPSGQTVAAIFITANTNGGNVFAVGSSSTILKVGNSNILRPQFGGAIQTFSVGNLPANVPVFYAASFKPATSCCLVCVRLDTGQIVGQGSISTATAAGAVGTIFAGNTSVGNQSMNGYIAALMFAPIFLSLQQLLMWAADPWGFWYPSIMSQLLVGGTAAAAFKAAWARNRNFVNQGGVAT